MSGDTTSDEEGSQEDSPRYDIDDLEIIKTIGEHDAIHPDAFHWQLLLFIAKLSIRLYIDTRIEYRSTTYIEIRWTRNFISIRLADRINTMYYRINW